MANNCFSQNMSIDDNDNVPKRENFIKEIKKRILSTYPNAEFDQEPYFKEVDFEIGTLFIPYFLQENPTYQKIDHVIIDKNFPDYLLLKTRLKTYLTGAEFIDFDPTSTGYISSKGETFSVLIHFDMCRNHLKEIIKTILELRSIDKKIVLQIGFTKSDNLKQNKLGGRTLIYLSYRGLVGKTISHLKTFESKLNIELHQDNFKRGVTIKKLSQFIYEINTELSMQKRNSDYWDNNRRDMLTNF